MAFSISAKGKEVEELNEYLSEEEEEDDDKVEEWDDWNADEDDESENGSNFKCLFCDSLFSSSNLVFEHCAANHQFDFQCIRKSLGLDFYGAFKLINYIRQMVEENRCWSCGESCESNQDLQNHLHRVDIAEDLKSVWSDDKYLVPFMEDDSILYSFDDDEDGDDTIMSVDKEELLEDLRKIEYVHIDDDVVQDLHLSSDGNGREKDASMSNGSSDVSISASKAIVNGFNDKTRNSSSDKGQTSLNFKSSLAKVAASEIRKVNESYFGSYSSFGIHREMLSDKARTDSYRQAIMCNPSLLNGAVVLDVGCGTGILSLFAAQAGASRVIAVDASEKMAATATQIANENGLLSSVQVLHGMVEDLNESIQPQSVDVLVSEWMGYCLLYESMLSSVLFARDKWLKPGGALLPDTATMFAAGFGKGGTSLQFWENVYGFNMSCVGKELVEDAAKFPIVDVVDKSDIVTQTACLQSFDLMTMKLDDMDFTTSIELSPKPSNPAEPTWCYGVVLWFENGFTSRFCKETPVVLSTSPYEPKTHWFQTILTFKEPIALSLEKPNSDTSGAVGTILCPAVKLQARISIARAVQHRAIDISLEIVGVSHGGQKRAWPLQIFNLL